MHLYNKPQNHLCTLRYGAYAAGRPHPVPSPASGRTLTPCPLPLARARGSDRRALRDHGIELKRRGTVALRATALPHKSGGFTLIEMMAVLVLIGVVMAIVGGRVFQNFQSAQYKAGVAQVHSLEMKVQAYVLDNGSTPQTLNDLVTRPGNATNWNGPYAKPADLKDPFGHAFIYKSPGDHGDFDITFLGKDGAPGGDALNKDTGNWE